MRAFVFALALSGCGPVLLGEEAPAFPEQLDGAPDLLDASRADAGRAGADAAAPDAKIALPLLCLQNLSFEGMPAFNTGVPEAFDAAPWSTCTNPAIANTPDVSNDTVPQIVATVPKATDGDTFLGMAEGEQASQALCAALSGGSRRSFRLDACKIVIGGAAVPDTEAAFVELWGGVAADCSQRELLWASPALTVPWQTFCVTLEPQQYTDSLTLRSRSDGSLPTVTSYVAIDNLVPVESCP